MSIVIEESDVSAISIALELERAVISHTLNDDERIYVTEDDWYPFWINLHKKAGLILFTTYTYFKKAATTAQRMEVCNELNKRSYMLTAYFLDHRLCIDYALSYRDGLLRETLIRSCRLYVKNIGNGLGEIDPDCSLVLRPGQIEPNDEDTN